jgi:membrane protease YdiL (CAAX protease family)
MVGWAAVLQCAFALVRSPRVFDAQSYFLRSVAMSGALIAPVVLWLKAGYGVRLAAKWLRVDSLAPEIAAGVILGVMIGVVNFIGVKLLLARGFLTAAPGDVLAVAFRAESPREIGLVVVGVAVVAPVCEEAFFRGALYPALRKRLAGPWAVIASAALFAVVHERNRMLTAFLLGLIAGIMFEYTGNLVVPVLMHAGTNLGFVLSLVKGGALARALPMWLLVAAFIVMNVHLLLAGKLLFSSPGRRASAPPPSDKTPVS